MSAASAAAAPAHSAAAKILATRLVFDNRSLRALPLDAETRNFVRSVPGACFSRVQPTTVANPRLVALAPDALALLGLKLTDAEAWALLEAQEGATVAAVAAKTLAELLCGNRLFEGSEPAAHCYCGHQFGHFSGQLGDGATMYLGEVVVDAARWELQLKGAGRTPYSRTADGRKVLRSSLREFLCSEAHHALGIATTRAASVVTSDTLVERDVFYTGEPIAERATIITRIAPTFLRFGSFEVCRPRDPVTGRSGPSVGRPEVLRALLDHTCRSYFSEIYTAHAARAGGEGDADAPERYLAMFHEVCRRTARLVASWQTLGFCHGVLNTDNMSIIGLTLDYGPFGWLERFDRDYICNASDTEGRYRFRHQPRVCQWNCVKLAESIEPFLGGLDWRPAVREFADEFARESLARFRRKLGLVALPPDTAAPGVALDEADESLIEDLLDVMGQVGADFSGTFRALMSVTMEVAAASAASAAADAALLDSLVALCATAREAADAARPRIPLERLETFRRLASSNAAIAAQLGEIDEEIARHAAHAVLAARSDDEKRSSDRELWSAWMARYRRRLTTQANVSGADLPELERTRYAAMASSNPRYILRNWIAQVAIRAAEAGDFSVVRHVHERLRDPFGLSDVDPRGDAFEAELAASRWAMGDAAGGGAAGGGAAPAGAGAGADVGAAPAGAGAARPPWAAALRVT